MPQFSIIIPVYNQWELTERCLRSLAAHTENRDYELIVADNGSTDATVEGLAGLGDLFSTFRVIRSEQRRSFALGCNAGARQARTDLLFFLNNDTQALPGWDSPLLEAFQRGTGRGDGWGAVAPLLLFEPDCFGVARVQHLGVAFSPVPEHLYAGLPHGHALVGRPRKMQALSAAALLISATLFAECGGFCERYQNGYEDLELCAHLRKRGLALSCVPQSVLYHDEGRSEGRFAANQENTRLYFERWAEQTHADLAEHYVRDGLCLFLNPWLEIRPALHAKDAAALAAACGDAQGSQQEYARTAFELVRANPLWEQGYHVAWFDVQSRGNPAEVLAFAALQNRFFPVPEQFRMAALARDAGQDALAHSIVEHAQRLTALLNNDEQLELRMRGILDTLAQTSQQTQTRTALQAALGDWRGQSERNRRIMRNAARLQSLV